MTDMTSGVGFDSVTHERGSPHHPYSSSNVNKRSTQPRLSLLLELGEMSDAYSAVKSGKLSLKTESKLKRKKKHKSKDRSKEECRAKKSRREQKAEDDEQGGWWKVRQLKELHGPVLLQVEAAHKQAYVKACDDGSFVMGPPHTNSVDPDPEEILLAVRVGESKVAFKSGYGKYLRVEGKLGRILGISDAIGGMEQFEAIFQDGKMALLGGNNRFMSLDSKDDTLKCNVEKASSPNEMIVVRSNAVRVDESKVIVPDEEQGNVGQVELNYVKKFQKFQDHKIKLNQNDRKELVRAKDEGKFHETMLDRRAKMKADRYCK